MAVEREVDKANDAFDLFYAGVDQDIDKTLANLTQMMNQLVSGRQANVLMFKRFVFSKPLFMFV